MKAYFASVMTAAIITAITSLISTDEAKTGKYVRHISSLMMLLVIASPLGSSADDISKIWESFEFALDSETVSDTDYREHIISEAASLIEEDIISELAFRYRISQQHASVTVTLDADDYTDVKVKSIRITLTSYGAWADKGAVERYFKEKYECEAVVDYE